MLAYAVTFARASTKLSKEEQDVMSRIMVKVSAEVLREGPHYLVGPNGGKQQLSDEEASALRRANLNRVRQARLRKGL